MTNKYGRPDQESEILDNIDVGLIFFMSIILLPLWGPFWMVGYLVKKWGIR